MQDAQYNPGVFPRDMGAWQRLHATQLLNPALLDPAARTEQSAIIDTDLYSGVEGWDYQNPYVWQSTQLQSVPTLVPAYGILGDTAQNVTRNVAQTSIPLETL